MDWKYILSVVPDELGENEKEDLFNAVAWYDCDEDSKSISKDKIIALFKITQEVLKFKGEQVESLVSELDELAARHGEEDARRQQEFEVELKSLRSQKGSVINDDLEGEVDKLRNKTKEQKKKIEKQSQDIERLKRNVSILEQEKAQLYSELQTGHRDSDSQSDISETVREYQTELQDSVRQKNQQISKLLTDIENIERENIVLRDNLGRVRDELSDATKHLNNASAEIQGLKTSLTDKSEEISDLEIQLLAVRTQIDDLVNDKTQQDAEFDEYTREVDGKIENWKKIIADRDAELSELRDKVSHLEDTADSPVAQDTDRAHVAALHKLLANRESHVEELQARLQQATEEMNASAKLIEQISAEKRDRSRSRDEILVEELKEQLRAAHERCQELQENTAEAEETAEMKGKELSNLIVQMEKYESGQFGLSDAVAQIRDLNTQIRVRDKQISSQIKQLNKKQIEMDMVDQENLALRAKLGIDPEDTVTTAAVIIQRKKEHSATKNLKNQIQLFDGERLEFKLEIQNLKRALGQLAEQIVSLGKKPSLDLGSLGLLGSTVGLDKIVKSGASIDSAKERQSYEGDRQILVEENEALRRGLHEILDCVRAKNESGREEIKAETLEKLLLALDSKHIAGWYHPAMRLQAELHSVEGGNAQLREQLRNAKSEIEELKARLHQLQQLLEDRPLLPKEEFAVPQPSEYVMPKNLTPQGEEIITKLNSDLKQVVNQNQITQENNTKLATKLEEYDVLIRDSENKIALLQTQHSTEKENWEQLYKELSDEKRSLEDKVAGMEATLREYDFQTQDEEALKRIKHSGEMSGELVVLNRRCLFLENNVNTLTTLNEKLKKDLLSGKLTTMRKINSLSEENLELSRNVLTMDKALKDSIPSSEHLLTSKRLDELAAKHRELLRSAEENFRAKEVADDLQVLREENELLKKETGELRDLLRNSREIVRRYESSSGATRGIEPNEEVDKLCKKLANSEINEVSEKQRADHATGLYELVKEQLQKSEERFRDSELHTKQLQHKNLLLQQNVQDLQDRLARSAGEEHVQILEGTVLDLQDQVADLEKDLAALRGVQGASLEERRFADSQRQAEEIEMLALKHQVLDLQCQSDDKAVIARLSSEVVIARLMEAEWKRNNEVLVHENEELAEANVKMRRSLRDMKKSHLGEMARCKEQLRILQDSLQQMRVQYVGCLPLLSNEKFVQSLQQATEDRRAAYLSLKEAQRQEHETKVRTELIEEQIKMVNELKRVFDDNGGGKTCEKIMEWYRDKNQVQLNELKHRRALEFKDSQLQQALQRLNRQDQQMSQLEEELLSIRFNKDYSALISDIPQPPQPKKRSFVDYAEKEVQTNVVQAESSVGQTRVKSSQFSRETQTDVWPTLDGMPSRTLTVFAESRAEGKDSGDFVDDPSGFSEPSTFDQEGRYNEDLKRLKAIAINALSAKDSRIGELQKNLQEAQTYVDALRTQIGDKQSQIMFYERRISELQQQTNTGSREEANDQQQFDILKVELENLRTILARKDENILEYQSLLKKDRDEHSLAAARLQDELKRMQTILANQQQTNQELMQSQSQTSQVEKAAIEQYIRQVHSLERHTDELQTSVAGLSSQLHSSREEAVRWRTLANERLEILEKLKDNLKTQHQEELSSYKSECEHWRERASTLEEDLRNVQHGDEDFRKKMQEKDSKILELTSTLKQIKNEARKSLSESEHKFVPQVTALEVAKLHLQNEHEALKKRFEQMLSKERTAREEIRSLKGQLMKRPLSSARSDSSDRVTKEQTLTKKISSLQTELLETKQKLEKEMAMNEMHRQKVDADFNNWDKQKRLQENVDKLRDKLKLKTEEYEKLDKTATGYRYTIKRLENEKHNLEDRLRTARSKSVVVPLSSDRSHFSEEFAENEKLRDDIRMLRDQLDIQKHRAGGLSASMMQDKLESQERKIAILELSAKGSVEVRAELERLQSSISILQKRNLKLEAENLDLSLNLERTGGDGPQLRDRIMYLEKYIEGLKEEIRKGQDKILVESNNAGPSTMNGDSKKNSELEKTVFLMRRVVEKLQAENKRLRAGSANTRVCFADRNGQNISVEHSLRTELQRIKEQYGESLQKLKKLQEELDSARGRIKMLENVAERPDDKTAALRSELVHVKTLLTQKSQLLDKVKVLLHKAAAREKSLHEQIAHLKALVPDARELPVVPENSTCSSGRSDNLELPF